MENEQGSGKALLKGEKVPLLERMNEWADNPVRNGFYRSFLTSLGASAVTAALLQAIESTAAHHPAASHLLTLGAIGTEFGVAVPAMAFAAGAAVTYVGLKVPVVAADIGKVAHDCWTDPNFRKELHKLGDAFKELTHAVFHPSEVAAEKAATKDR